MSKAFLSHSSSDKPLVEKVADKLGKDNCIYDKYSFEVGLPTLDEIISGLTETDIFVFFISSKSLDSEWVKKELKSARELMSENIIQKFYPILIDDKVSHNDARIPKWINKYYNLKPITEAYLITKKIQRQLRELALQRLPSLKLREQLFVGRNDIIEEFENKYFTTENIKPRCIVMSGIEGIGRRTVLKRCLLKVGGIKEQYSPLVMYLDSKESVEDFIIKVQDLDGKEAGELLGELQKIDLEEKIELAQKLLSRLSEYNEKLFIVDSGCIIKPTRQMAPWFLGIISSELFKNNLVVCIISRFRLTSNPQFLKNREFISIHVPELPKTDIEKLFIRYSGMLDLTLEKEETLTFTEILNGIPAQVYYCVDLIKEQGLATSIKNSKDIVDYGETQVFYLIELVRKNPENLDFLVLLCQFEFVSFNFLKKIIDDENKIFENFESLYALGVLDLIGSAGEYIKVHYSVNDYIRRSKFNLRKDFKEKLRDCIRVFLKEHSSQENSPDVSELLINVQSALIENQKVPEQYYLPSFVLKTIVNKYYQRDYKEVINLTSKILDGRTRFDPDIVREIRYWLCLAYARKSDPKLEIAVEEIDGADHHFLWGFYYRIKRDFIKSESSLRRALEISPNFNRAKRELVNVLLSKGSFGDALNLAAENYSNGKTNAFHIQAYFMCLIRKRKLDDSDKKILDDLMQKMTRSHDPKSGEIHLTMIGEYEFYVKRDYTASIVALDKAIKSSEFKSYPVKALIEIHERNGSPQLAENLRGKYSDLLVGAVYDRD